MTVRQIQFNFAVIQVQSKIKLPNTSWDSQINIFCTVGQWIFMFHINSQPSQVVLLYSLEFQTINTALLLLQKWMFFLAFFMIDVINIYLSSRFLLPSRCSIPYKAEWVLFHIYFQKHKVRLLWEWFFHAMFYNDLGKKKYLSNMGKLLWNEKL